ncbi:MAG: hypothetical protein CVU06_02045 [Bacteroidetes bacterium HGW-Bacteroidetes-22]|nr:MAG: hypothetical protein CVU06_02045 [Bacteroidetes bacterium HGW-Bacteroidetes-22]
MYKNKAFDAQSWPLPDTEFENCTFTGCTFNQTDLSGFEFKDCSFHSCDLSMVKLEAAVLHGVLFENCKLIGTDFSKVSRFLFTISFRKSILDYCLFHKTNLKKTTFDHCSLRETIFAEADLTEAKFPQSDLTDATFEHCNLMSADFRTAQNYTIDTSQNRVKNARFAYPGVLGLLKHLGIALEDD